MIKLISKSSIAPGDTTSIVSGNKVQFMSVIGVKYDEKNNEYLVHAAPIHREISIN